MMKDNPIVKLNQWFQTRNSLEKMIIVFATAFITVGAHIGYREHNAHLWEKKVAECDDLYNKIDFSSALLDLRLTEHERCNQELRNIDYTGRVFE